MNPKEILERLERAKELISTFPEDTRILTVQVDGLGGITGQDTNYIHLGNPIQLLADAGMIEAGGWTTKTIEDGQKREVLEDGVLINGFPVISIRYRKKAAPGVTSTEDGTTGQDPIDNTNSITAGKEEVKP